MGRPGLPEALARRPPALAVDDETWARLGLLHRRGQLADAFATAFANGADFLGAPDGLRARTPRLIEWTGGRRPPGDEAAPIDLRVDHVYLISCKYLSDNLLNASPGRLFDGLLARSGRWERGDWYETTAPAEYQALYRACRAASRLGSLPERAAELSVEQRRALRHALPGRRYPADAAAPYRALCAAVSARSAERWRARLAEADPERMLWRLLRIGDAPYFLLGAHGERRLALRVDTPWDWRQQFHLQALGVEAAEAGQPRVDWTADYRLRPGGPTRQVRGHVEIRWSHGKFSQPPEAKVYVDTPADQIPGYHPLEGGEGRPGAQLPLFDA
jgi:hypothetical protein